MMFLVECCDELTVDAKRRINLIVELQVIVMKMWTRFSGLCMKSEKSLISQVDLTHESRSQNVAEMP